MKDELLPKHQLNGQSHARHPPPGRPTGPTDRPSRPLLSPADMENQRVKDGYRSFRGRMECSASLTLYFHPNLTRLLFSSDFPFITLGLLGCFREETP